MTDHDATITLRARDVASPGGAALLVAHCPDPDAIGRLLPIPPRGVRLGRAPTGRQAVALPDPAMSRDHVDVWIVETGLVACTDRGSKNGTHVDGQRVATCYLEPGAVIRCANTLLLLVDQAPAPPAAEAHLLGTSPAIAAVRRQIEAVAPTALPVLLLGETGTGKDVAAQAIHARSSRPGELVALNCATVPESLVSSTLFGHVRGAFTGASAASPGLIRQADRGTLFLDEVDELPPVAQAALLRVVEDGVVVPVGATTPHRTDVRLIAASARDLTAPTAPTSQAAFRTDLLARLDDVRIVLPPLRERREDVLPLFAHFWSVPHGDPCPPFEPDAAEALLLDPWPHNVRALRRLAIRLATLHRATPSVTLDLLPEPLRAPILEREGRPPAHFAAVAPSPPPAELEDLLRELGGNVSQAAERLGKDRKQLYRWLKRYGIDPAEFRGDA